MALMAGIGMAATIAGGAITAYWQEQSGKMEQRMYDYRAAIAEQNRIYESALGERKAGEAGLRERQQMGHIVATEGGSGLDVNRGSARDVQKGQYAISQIEQEDIRDAAKRRALEQQEQSKLFTATGQQARYAGGIKAAGTILGTTASVASKWSQAGSMGLGSGEIDTGMGLSPFGGSTMFG